jgi:hypothetical protein
MSRQTDHNKLLQNIEDLADYEDALLSFLSEQDSPCDYPSLLLALSNLNLENETEDEFVLDLEMLEQAKAIIKTWGIKAKSKL